MKSIWHSRLLHSIENHIPTRIATTPYTSLTSSTDTHNRWYTWQVSYLQRPRRGKHSKTKRRKVVIVRIDLGGVQERGRVTLKNVNVFVRICAKDWRRRRRGRTTGRRRTLRLLDNLKTTTLPITAVRWVIKNSFVFDEVIINIRERLGVDKIAQNGSVCLVR